MRSPIKFGTDGWRAVIADGFTFENVRNVSKALAGYLNSLKPSASVIIGYDTRFHSKAFAETAAKELSLNGINVVMSPGVLSTPAVSANVVELKADAGVVISASHNPPEFNGFKIKISKGCSAPETVTNAIEQRIAFPAGAFKGHPGKITSEKLLNNYFNKLIKYIDYSTIKKSRLKIACDPMYGAACGYFQELLKGTKLRLFALHNTPDPDFGGLHPEPIESELHELKKLIKMNSADIGVATDGDADRVGVIDEKGVYYSPHQAFSLLLYYLCHYKKMKGKVVQTISLGYVSERIAEDYSLPFEETPIGFKYIAERILKEKVLIGGEESGGYGYGDFLPERDGVLNSLMFIEMLSVTGKPLSVLLKDIEKKYGSSAFLRTDFKKPADALWTKEEFVKTVKNKCPDKVCGVKVKGIKDYDGVELILEDDSWLLLRPSGTEPLIRVYCESGKIERTKKIIAWGNGLIKSLI